MRVRLAAAALLAAALACSNRQAEVKDEIGRRCLALVPGKSTLRDASNAFADAISSGGADVLLPSCAADRVPAGGDDICPKQPGATTCIVRFEFLTNDCGATLGGGTCAFDCDVRFAERPTSSSAVMCAREFLTNQPVLAAPAGAPPP